MRALFRFEPDGNSPTGCWKNTINTHRFSLILAQTGCYGKFNIEAKRASVFSAYGRKFKPPAWRAVVDFTSDLFI
jgi:hypothetical protein